MIECTINGQKAVPSIKGSLKITLENAFIKERDEWTMDIVFPMDIHENAVIFGHCNRLQVSRRVKKYDDCILYADNTIIIRGVGIVTSVTDTEVKLQIKSGIQGIAYLSDAEKIYIDKISYPVTGLNWLDKWNNKDSIEALQTGDWRYAFVPVYDETNDRILNKPYVSHEYWMVEPYQAIYAMITNQAIQPSLDYVIQRVIEHMGYTLEDELWYYATINLPRIYICNARETRDIAKALPHWTVKRFLDEVRAMLNVTFIFDEGNKQVKVVRNNPREAEKVEYECLDEFTTDYDEAGLEYSGSSNLEYNLSSSSLRTLCEDIPDKAFDMFETLEYSSHGDMLAAWEQMSEWDKRTHIFHCPDGWHYTHKYEENVFTLERARFQHIRRGADADNTITLNIVPVAMGKVDFEMTVRWKKSADESYMGLTYSNSTLNTFLYLPCMENTKGDESEEYLSVQSVAEEGAEQAEEERMEVMFLMPGGQAIAYNLGEIGFVYMDYNVNWTNLEGTVGVAGSITDSDIIPWLAGTTSFSLVKREGIACIGDFHEENKVIEDNEQTVIKFITRGKPDPRKIYIFRNKEYLCDKIEMNVTEEGIDKIATGHFYEIT